MRNKPVIADLLKDLQDHGKLENKEAIKVLKSYNICDSEGNLEIPVIFENSSDELFTLCKSLTKKIRELILANLDFEKIEREFGLRSRYESLTLVINELLWDIVGYFEERGTIQKPVIFADTQNADLEDVADVMIVVMKEKK